VNFFDSDILNFLILLCDQLNYLHVQSNMYFSSLHLMGRGDILALKPPITYRRHQVVQLRHYATPIDKDNNHNNIDNDLLELLHSYPTYKNASPYEVMGFGSDRLMKTSTIKKRFHKLARIYHPDSTKMDGCSLCKRTFFTANEKQKSGTERLTQEIKTKRFKRIMIAYALLKSPLSRSNYDNYQVGWEDNSNTMHRSPNPNSYNPNSAYYNHMYQRYQQYGHSNTGTWEDHWNPYDRAHEFRDDNTTWEAGGKTFGEEFRKNRTSILISIVLFLATYGALQVTHMYLFDDLISEDYRQTYSSDEIEEACKRNLMNAHGNFGLRDTKEDRINRFLWFREISMLLRIGDFKQVMEYMKGKQMLKEDKKTGRILLVKYQNDELMNKKEEYKKLPNGLERMSRAKS